MNTFAKVCQLSPKPKQRRTNSQRGEAHLVYEISKTIPPPPTSTMRPPPLALALHSSSGQLHHHHYALDAATLLDQCLAELQDVLRRTKSSVGYRACKTLFDLRTALSATEKLLLQHLESLLLMEQHDEQQASPELTGYGFAFNDVTTSTSSPSLASLVGNLRLITEQRQMETLRHAAAVEIHPGVQSSGFIFPNTTSSSSLSTSSSSNKMLFNLVVALQLCLVRLDDARFVLTGRRKQQEDSNNRPASGLKKKKTRTKSSCSRYTSGSHTTSSGARRSISNKALTTTTTKDYHHHVCVQSLVHAGAYVGTLLYGTGFLASAQRLQVAHFFLPWRSKSSNQLTTSMAGSWCTLGVAATLGARWLRQTWNTWWMSSKIVDSTRALELWNRQWHLMLAEERHRSRPCLHPVESRLSRHDDDTVHTVKKNIPTTSVRIPVTTDKILCSRAQVSWGVNLFQFLLL